MDHRTGKIGSLLELVPQGADVWKWRGIPDPGVDGCGEQKWQGRT